MIMIGSVNVILALMAVVIIQAAKEEARLLWGKALPAWLLFWIPAVASALCALVTAAWPLTLSVVADAAVYWGLMLIAFELGVKRILEPVLQRIVPGFSFARGEKPEPAGKEGN